MLRFPTSLTILTIAVACGPRKAAPDEVSDRGTAVVTTPVAPRVTAIPVDAAVAAPPQPPPPPPEPPTLACDDGATAQPAAFPEPTWFCTRADGSKHGPFVTVFPDHSVASEGRYENGKLHGAWKRNHPGGALAEEGTYVAGLPTGTWRQLAPDGTVLGTYALKAGSGKQRRWYDSGSLYSETTLHKGVRHGPMTVRTHDGAVVIAAKFHNGKLDDKHVVGAKSSLRIEETFVRGVRRGPRQIWQFWALLIDETYDDRGRLDGAFTIWRDKKTPRVEGTYDHGKRVGTWVWTDRQNNREREGDYVAGKKSGTWNEYAEGKLTFTGTYTDGKPDGEFVYYDKTGAVLGRFTISGGNGTQLTFHANKKPATKTRIANGLMNGKHEELSPRGKTLVEGSYASDRKHGIWREQTEAGVPISVITWKRGKLDGAYKKFIDGALAVEATYKDGKAEGRYVEYRAGKPYLTGQFAADRRSGTWTIHDAAGTPTLTATYVNGVLDGPWREITNGFTTDGTLALGRRTGTWTTAPTP